MSHVYGEVGRVETLLGLSRRLVDLIVRGGAYEPTASLDAEAEAAVFEELRRHLRGRTGIVISHRFSTVRAADKVAVIEGGRLIELGHHDELVAAGGRYARLFELQAAGYR